MSRFDRSSAQFDLGPAFAEFLSKDAARINATIKRIGQVD